MHADKKLCHVAPILSRQYIATAREICYDTWKAYAKQSWNEW